MLHLCGTLVNIPDLPARSLSSTQPYISSTKQHECGAYPPPHRPECSAIHQRAKHQEDIVAGIDKDFPAIKLGNDAEFAAQILEKATDSDYRMCKETVGMALETLVALPKAQDRCRELAKQANFDGHHERLVALQAKAAESYLRDHEALRVAGEDQSQVEF
jgi:hypothetical protein